MKVSQIKKALKMDDKEIGDHSITNEDLVFRTAYANNKISPPIVLKQLTTEDCLKRLGSKYAENTKLTSTASTADNSTFRTSSVTMAPTPANMSKKSQPTEVAPSK